MNILLTYIAKNIFSSVILISTFLGFVFSSAEVLEFSRKSKDVEKLLTVFFMSSAAFAFEILPLTAAVAPLFVSVRLRREVIYLESFGLSISGFGVRLFIIVFFILLPFILARDIISPHLVGKYLQVEGRTKDKILLKKGKKAFKIDIEPTKEGLIKCKAINIMDFEKKENKIFSNIYISPTIRLEIFGNEISGDEIYISSKKDEEKSLIELIKFSENRKAVRRTAYSLSSVFFAYISFFSGFIFGYKGIFYILAIILLSISSDIIVYAPWGILLLTFISSILLHFLSKSIRLI